MNFEENTEDFQNKDSGQSTKAILVQRIYARTSNFVTALKELKRNDNEDECERDAFRKYLDFCYVFGSNGKINGSKNPLSITFKSSEYENINRSEIVDMQREAKRNVIVIEFFTHCCINCIHSIEDIRQVYEDLQKTKDSDAEKFKYKCGLKIISVHSPKFAREKERESIKAFTQRMQMDYSDVINDPECFLWNDLGICCWPTVLVLGPTPLDSGPNLLFTLMGEGHRENLKLILESSLKYFDEKFDFDNLSLGSQSANHIEFDQVDFSLPSVNKLNYPGKVTYYKGLLGIADSGNNRIIIASEFGTVKYVVGGYARGYKDGDFETAKFYNPQGIAFENENVIYVADTGNHAIRKIELRTRMVTTLVPVNFTCQVREEAVLLKSPWDVAFYSPSILLIAAAGNHRIFAYFFEKIKLFNTEYAAESCNVIAGSGKEENRNNSYILKASFAQPCGICVTSEKDGSKTIYIADSESSSIRSISSIGKVVGLVGGALDPTDLFAYGDVDGKGIDVKLQHPMGVGWQIDKDVSKLYITDTYNHKVKVIDVEKKNCKTLIGDGIAGNDLGVFNRNGVLEGVTIAKFNEPGGISISENGRIYIADTNNHLIKVANISEGNVDHLALNFNSVSVPPLPNENVTDTFNEVFEVKIDPWIEIINLNVSIKNIAQNFEGGTWGIQPLYQKWDEIIKGTMSKKLDEDEASVFIQLSRSLLESKEYALNVDIFLCGESSCYKRSLKFLFSIVFTSTVQSSNQNQDKNKCNYTFNYKPNSDFFL